MTRFKPRGFVDLDFLLSYPCIGLTRIALGVLLKPAIHILGLNVGQTGSSIAVVALIVL